MADITHNGKTFVVSDESQAQYSELITLIVHTDSMDDNERQYWFDIMPSMTGEQVDRLFNILDTEKNKLNELETKYQQEIKQLNEKHLIEWQDFQTKDSSTPTSECRHLGRELFHGDILRIFSCYGLLQFYPGFFEPSVFFCLFFVFLLFLMVFLLDSLPPMWTKSPIL